MKISISKSLTSNKGVGGFTHFVDSVSGNDANSGRSPGQALQNLTALPTITQGMRIGLARGSTWRQQLIITANNVVVGAYGSGARPILDCADIISAGSWSKTGGFTNLYQVTITVQPGVDASEWPGVWINGVRIPKATSQANCDATAGTFWNGVVTDLTSITVYVNSTGSTNPAVDGKLYEMAVRSSSIDTYNAQYCEVRSIQGRRNYTSYGSITNGRYCQATDCWMTEGNTHNYYGRQGSVATDCWFLDAYADGVAGPILGVVYEDTPTAGSTASFLRCRASLTVYDASTLGFYMHTNGGGSNFAGLSLTDCVADNIGVPFASANCTLTTVTRPLATNFLTAFKFANSAAINDFNLSAAKPGAQPGIFDADNITYTVRGGVGVFNATGAWRVGKANCTLDVQGVTMTGPNTVINGTSATNLTVVHRGNTYIPNGHMATLFNLPGAGLTPGAGLNLDSDYNTWGGTVGQMIIGATTYASLALYQAGTGQDSHSTN